MKKLAEMISTEGAVTGLQADAEARPVSPLQSDSPIKRSIGSTDENMKFDENALMRWADDGGFCPPNEE